MFPRYRLVGFCGLPGFAGARAARGRRAAGPGGEIERMAARYAVDRQPLPVLELIAVVAQNEPGRGRQLPGPGPGAR